MNGRFTVKQQEKGIALVITLVMLAVVTVMAIVFLAVTRRERSSVIVTQETAIAKDMADAALERVKTEVLARMNSSGSRLNYDIFNSHAYYHPNWFNAGLAPTNVNVGPPWQWLSLYEPEYLELLSNLQYDPAVPVFIETNRNGLGDLRFYLDFNRNRQFETNGTWPVRDFNNDPIRDANNIIISNRFVGDPEWIGVLERPDFPHSETNRFIGRLAYLVLPAGKSLDLNFIHNQVNGTEDRLDINTTGNSFSRGQGVGPWEINLAAFFRELNTNNYAWFPASYQFVLQPSGFYQPSGEAFDDARTLLSYRYDRRSRLIPMQDTLVRYNLLNPGQNLNTFANIHEDNLVQDFSSRPIVQSGNPLRPFFTPGSLPDNENNQSTTRPWPGSLNTNAFTDIQQLFSVDATSPEFVQRLSTPALLAADGGSGNSGRSSYDRYTFYRLAAQLGTDSKPWVDGKVHLNFKNPPGLLTNTTERWTDHNQTNDNPTMFFVNAADAMLKSCIDGRIVIDNHQLRVRYSRPFGTYDIIGDTLVRTNFSVTNILVYATNSTVPGVVINEYTSTIHRILQVAANIYDSMHNEGAYPYFPTVFAPQFTRVQGGAGSSAGIILSGFRTITNSATALVNRPWVEFDRVAADATEFGRPITNNNFFGQHLVIGAKKGLPNFNELALNTKLDVSRKIAFTKSSEVSTNIALTNQLYVVNLSQKWGLEAWNSYTNSYPRPLNIRAAISSDIALHDITNTLPAVYFARTNFITNIVTNNWTGVSRSRPERNMAVLINQDVPLISERSYYTANGTAPYNALRFRGASEADFTSLLEPAPQFILYTTNKVQFWILDGERIVDFVSFDELVTTLDMTAELRRNGNNLADTPAAVNYWDTNLVSPGLTVGVSNQIAVSLGEKDEPKWGNYRYTGDKTNSITKIRDWLGLPLRYWEIKPTQQQRLKGLRQQLPYTPTKQKSQTMTWQANDPLVHYIVDDLRRKRGTDVPITLDNENSRVYWNIGLLNDIYHPWSGSTEPEPQRSRTDPFSWKLGLMDPGIRSSDHWEFQPLASDRFQYPNIGVLGQVHRGTPWQTLYLKSFYRVNSQSGVIETNNPSLWYEWTGRVGNHPMQDWRLLDCFTTALNENSARGLLSVNQTNAAAWSAVLSGALAARNVSTKQQADNAIITGLDPKVYYDAQVLQPGSAQIAEIITSINQSRTNQYRVVRHPNPGANQNQPYIAIPLTNTISGRPADTFRYMGEILTAPALSIQNPFLNPGNEEEQVWAVWTDKAVEYLPQQILSLLQRDEPRFVVYAFGQSLKPAPRSLTTDPNYYHMCTNYQITGEVITKTTFRVEGQPRSTNAPLRAVVEKYEVMPPLE